MDRKSAKQGERIAKVIARAGLCSRREAEGWIAAGRVVVNGAVISSPAIDVAADDRIEVDGEPLPVKERTRLFLYHKPRGLVTTSADPQGRPTIFAKLPRHLPRLISVGRLDLNSEGLLLLTNDGGLARALELPETGWLRRYRVRALGHVTQQQLDTLRGGLTVDGIHYGSIEATLDREQGANVWLTLALREGKNREVRNVLGALDLKVNRLIRVSYGPFQLGELPEGGVVEVRTRHLREQIGPQLAATAGLDFAGPIVQTRRHQSQSSQELTQDSRHSQNVQSDRPPPPARTARGGEGSGVGADARGKAPHAGASEREWPAAHDRKRDAGKPPPRKQRHFSDTHAWRGGDAPLRRKYRGDRRSDEAPREESTAPKRAGLLADRKGRHILVERFGTKPPSEHDERTRDDRRKGQRKPPRGRRPPRDRSSGPRPSRPRAPRER